MPLALALLLAAAAAEPLGPSLEGLPPPLPVALFRSVVEGQDVRLAYVDLAPTAPANGRAVLLLHGKNFWCDYWADTARALAAKGFRVVIPDQLGFGRSSKPEIHYSFELLALQTRALLEHLGVRQVAVVGHSMGGMLAVRFTLMYPEVVTQLVLEDPIGLEDYRAKVPYRTVDDWYRSQLGQTEEGVRRFYQAYFARWSDAYERWPQAAWRAQAGAEGARVARASALTYDMIYTQPVVQDLPRLRVPSLLVIGQSDRTAVGKAFVPKEVAATLGDYPALGKRAAQVIPGARLVELDGVGHIPHLEAPERFQSALLGFLR
jgi:pimeloyl-ACP methyl ester carboxylesterase